MDPPDLLTICITAFIAVFILLALLAGVMRLITSLFPLVRELVSTVHVAAITTTVQALFPGAKVTQIEEVK